MTNFINVTKGQTKGKTVFTHNYVIGKTPTIKQPEDGFETVKYLGRCKNNGDLFAAYVEGFIILYAGVKGYEFD